MKLQSCSNAKANIIFYIRSSPVIQTSKIKFAKVFEEPKKQISESFDNQVLSEIFLSSYLCPSSPGSKLLNTLFLKYFIKDN